MQRLLESGCDVMVWNRTPERLHALTALGAKIAAEPVELSHHADFIVTCLTDGAAVEAVVFGSKGVAVTDSDDKILIDMSTTDPGHTTSMADRLLNQYGMHWIDAPISGGAPAARNGQMTVMAGGSQRDFDKAKTIWDALASRCTLMGPNGAGQTTKMLNQVLVACTLAVLGEVCGFAERSGVNSARIPHALGGGRADSYLLQEYMPKMAESDFSVEGRIALMVKDLDMVEALANQADAQIPMTAVAGTVFRKLTAAGFGDRDNSELVNLYRRVSLP
jgi:3-hydroxyisobutyrate dehydrogenase-like beta-hydroxyacid dehydrogenase